MKGKVYLLALLLLCSWLAGFAQPKQVVACAGAGITEGARIKNRTAQAPQGNPFIRNMYLADPSAHVWGDGRLYVYPSHDTDPPRGCDLMECSISFSSW
ncbi:hypothetical protein FACS189438_2770 [Bacteroidia bacterium]|nr:hypothetical protein FACS189438_2770 [Bacteroidia bacterium]